MTIELFFVAASFVVGVSQVVEAWMLVRSGGKLDGSMAATSIVEFSWALFCVYLLATGRLDSARWLAIFYLAGMPAAIIVSLYADRAWFKAPPETVRVPKVAVYFGGLLGAAFAVASLVLLAS